MYIDSSRDDFVRMQLVTEAATMEFYKFRVKETKFIKQGVYGIVCEMIMGESVGFFYSGQLDFTDPLKPKIDLKSDEGHAIRNITRDGLRFKERYIPDLYIGK